MVVKFRSEVSVPAHEGIVYRGIRPPEGVSFETYVANIIENGGFPQKGTNFEISNQVAQGPNSGLAGTTQDQRNAALFSLMDRNGTQFNQGLLIKTKKSLPSYDTLQAYELAGHKIPSSGEMESSIHSGLPLEYIEN
jgi:hypothetical protein